MKNLMRKELLLAMHPASVLFLLLSAMLLIPNYPYYVICFYTCLGTFFICLTGRENRDIEFTAVLYGVFNLVFFRNYYRAPGKVGKAFGWGCGALTLCMVVFEACAHTVPFVRDRLDTPDPAFLGEKLTLLAAGAALYVLLSALALRRAMHSFAALDL